MWDQSLTPAGRPISGAGGSALARGQVAPAQSAAAQDGVQRPQELLVLRGGAPQLVGVRHALLKRIRQPGQQLVGARPPQGYRASHPPTTVSQPAGRTSGLLPKPS